VQALGPEWEREAIADTHDALSGAVEDADQQVQDRIEADVLPTFVTAKRTLADDGSGDSEGPGFGATSMPDRLGGDLLEMVERAVDAFREGHESAVLDDAPHLSTTTDTDESDEREEPEVPVYSDMLLLLDALERENPTALEAIETPALVNLYTLLSDVQRNANTLRKDVSNVLLERVQHDCAVHGQYGSIQRTTRRNRSLKADEEVLAALKDAGIAREQVVSVDREKVDEALDVVSTPESAVYETDESEYIRKAKVDEERKETRLQGLKDRLAVSDDPEADVLRQEVERLEQEMRTLPSSRRAVRSTRRPKAGNRNDPHCGMVFCGTSTNTTHVHPAPNDSSPRTRLPARPCRV
jgi:hypothetical protein